MSVQTYTINLTQPVGIYPAGQGEPVTVMNNETARTVLLSDLPGSTGFPLSAGSSMTWDAGKALYAWVEDATKPVVLVVLDNGGSITNAAAIAQQIIAGGLADQIAASITASSLASQIGGAVPVPPSAGAIGSAVGGAVPVPPSASAIGTAVGGAVPVPPSAGAIGSAVGGAVPVPPSASSIGSAVATSPLPGNTATAIKNAGVPSIDVPADLHSGTGASISNLSLDISRYASVAITAYQYGTLSATDDVSVLLEFNGAFNIRREAYHFYGTGTLSVETPARGISLVVTVLVNGVATNIGAVGVYVTGSYRSIGEATAAIGSARWGTGSWSNNGDAFTHVVGMQTAAANITTTNRDYPPFIPGPATLQYKIGAAITAGYVTAYLRDMYGNYLGGWQLDSTSKVGLYSMPIRLPHVPVYFEIAPSTSPVFASGINTHFFSLTY
jgi:hypothetical protein